MTQSKLGALSNEALVAGTRAIAARSNSLCAVLVAHLAEIDARKIYLEQAHPSLFSWCMGELGISEDVTCNLIAVARASRKWPTVLWALREGRVQYPQCSYPRSRWPQRN